MKNFLVAGLLILLMNIGFGQQKSISITVDDVPNTSKYEEDGYKPILLKRLDSMDIPYTIFINEDKVYKTDSLKKNKQLLQQWIKHENALLGNHSYSHMRYSNVGFDHFSKDVQKGALITKPYASSIGKPVDYFRFPFNDLGIDSLQHIQMKQYLNSEGYIIAPFTIESSDWMFDFVYQHFLREGQIDKAKSVGEAYVRKSIEMVKFFDEMSLSIYGRYIKHIYLCHDNSINADYLHKVVNELQNEGYVIDGFADSLKDPVYTQENNYYKKWGISWLYRWMNSQEERFKWMKQEPDLSEIQASYDEINRE